jgi:hypothetical protein
VLLEKNLNFAGADVANSLESVKQVVANTGKTDQFTSGQDLIAWHKKELATGRQSLHLYHKFALGLIAMPVVNVKAESIFSRHKRMLGKDRTTKR